MNDTERLQLIKKKHGLLLAKKKYKEDNRVDFFRPYEWQLDYWHNTITKRQLLVKAAVRVGKTDTTTIAAACWLTNYYPKYWNGYRFNFPVNAYVLGNSFGQLKRVLQVKLLGDYDSKEKRFTGGWIKPKYISDNPSDLVWNGAIKGGVASIRILTESNHKSTLYFFSYNQGQDILMGDSVDVALIDEQPTDPSIYPQILNRLSLGNRGVGGLALLSLTPEFGLTPLLQRFQDKESAAATQYFSQVTWWDAPHWTEEKIKEELAALPPYLRDLKSKGVEVAGTGMVYPFDTNQAIVYSIPELPNMKYLGAIDLGIKTGAIGLFAYDNESGTVYLKDAVRTDEWGTERIANKMLSYGQNVKWAWPHDGNQVKENTGNIITKVQHFRDLGVKMLPNAASVKYLDNGKEKNSFSVEAGIVKVYELLNTSKFKIHALCADAVLREMRMYYREKGKIRTKVDEEGAKVGDHIMDMLRYGVISIDFASSLNDNLRGGIQPRYINRRK